MLSLVGDFTCRAPENQQSASTQSLQLQPPLGYEVRCAFMTLLRIDTNCCTFGAGGRTVLFLQKYT